MVRFAGGPVKASKIVTSVAAATAALACVCLLTSCNQSHARREDGGVMGAAPQHGKQGQHLRDTMHRLAGHTAYSPVGKLPADPESQKPVDPKVFDDAADLAAGLASTAKQIPARAKDRPMSDADRHAFEAEAGTLRRYAVELERAAKAHKIEQMQRAFDGVNASCLACHSRFRDFAGQLDFGKAAADADLNRDLAAAIAR
jgi:cytochrome c556